MQTCFSRISLFYSPQKRAHFPVVHTVLLVLACSSCIYLVWRVVKVLLSVTSQVAKHLTKLFDSMAKLKFRQENDEDTKIALHMSSKDGEEVKLSSPCDCDGQVSSCDCDGQVSPCDCDGQVSLLFEAI